MATTTTTLAPATTTAAPATTTTTVAPATTTTTVAPWVTTGGRIWASRREFLRKRLLGYI